MLGAPTSIADILKRVDGGSDVSSDDHVANAEALGVLLAEVDGVDLSGLDHISQGETAPARSYWTKAVAAYSFLLGIDVEAIIAERDAVPVGGIRR